MGNKAGIQSSDFQVRKKNKLSIFNNIYPVQITRLQEQYWCSNIIILFLLDSPLMLRKDWQDKVSYRVASLKKNI